MCYQTKQADLMIYCAMKSVVIKSAAEFEI